MCLRLWISVELILGHFCADSAADHLTWKSLKCFEKFLQAVWGARQSFPFTIRSQTCSVCHWVLKGFLTEGRSSFCSHWSSLPHTVDVCWLIWCVSIRCDCFTLTYHDPCGLADEPMTLKNKDWTPVGRRVEEAPPATRELCTREVERSDDATHSPQHKEMWTLHIWGSDQYDCGQLLHKYCSCCPKSLILNVFCKDQKIGHYLTMLAAFFFSSDSKLT